MRRILPPLLLASLLISRLTAQPSFVPSAPRPTSRPASNDERLFNLPAGLHLGQSSEAAEAALRRGWAEIASREDDGYMIRWEVKKLFVSNIESATFYFMENNLEEIEMHFGRPEWPEKRFRQLLNDLYLRLEVDYGNRDDAWNDDSAAAPGVKQHVEGFEWKTKAAEIKLSYFAAQSADKNKTFRSVTINFARLNSGGVAATSASVPLPADLPPLLPDGPSNQSLALFGGDSSPPPPAANHSSDIPSDFGAPQNSIEIPADDKSSKSSKAKKSPDTDLPPPPEPEEELELPAPEPPGLTGS